MELNFICGEIWIVVLTFNGWANTRACLQSVFAQPRDNVHVLVVDNGSTDETRTAVCREFPVELITNDSNLGYAEGNNVGMRYAMAHGAMYVMILNNDVIVERGWLEPLLDAAQKNPRAALLGPLVFHADEPNIIQSAGGILSQDWRALHRGANEKDDGQFTGTNHVDWLTGCCILARTNALREIGLFDSSLYMYGEDLDWALAARRAGYDVLCVPQTRVWHKGVQRAYKPAPYVTYYLVRNELALVRKHRGGMRTTVQLWARHLRTLASWSILPRWREQRAARNALARALYDAARHKSGRGNLV